MWWILVVIAVIGFWVAFRKSGIAPKLILLLAVPFLLVLAIVSLQQTGRDRASRGEVGHWLEEQERPSLDLSGSFQNLEGRTVSLADFGGKLLFLNIWATWCGPCRQEMPSMAELYREFSGQGLAMTAVSDEDVETVRDYLEANPYPFPILVDSAGTLPSRFGVNAIPTTFILDDQGRLVYQHVGFNDWSAPSVREKIGDLLK